MTAVWGPLGWMTLHSVATLYPEEPTPQEQTLLTMWLDMFRDTITCPSCRDHFTKLLAKYRQLVPNLMSSRQTFTLFTFRAHNAVNRRLQKPMHTTVEACMTALKGPLQIRSAGEYRRAYLAHITRHWRTYRDITGISALRKITELNRIEADYCVPRDTNFAVTIAPDVVVLPQDALESVPQETSVRIAPNSRYAPSGGIRLTGGGIRIRR